jgi:hypothetical protein
MNNNLCDQALGLALYLDRVGVDPPSQRRSDREHVA